MIKAANVTIYEKNNLFLTLFKEFILLFINDFIKSPTSGYVVYSS